MNVLMIHEHARPWGGGGLVAMYRLHKGLQEAGVRSSIACRRKLHDSPDIYELPRSDRLESVLGTISWRLGLNDVHCVSSFKIKNFQPFLDADIVHTHGLHTNYFNYLALPGMARHKPIIMTLHDMWSLTGHCSQSQECERWKTGCGKCPHPEVYPPIGRDGTAIEWRLKNWVYKRTPLTIVSPSKWLANLARQSMLSHYDIHHIPNGVDTTTYRPLDKAACRNRLGIAAGKLVIMFAAAAMNVPAKGADLLIAALQRLPESLKSRCVLLLIGDRSQSVSDTAGIPAISLGFLREDEAKIVAYSAADMFVLPSRAENHSLVLLEAMACGTPGVAFNVGGNPEIVRHLQTGYLAPAICADDLHDGIRHLLEHGEQRAALGRNARQLICDEFSLKHHIERYMNLYSEVIEHAASPSAAATSQATVAAANP